MIKFNDFYKFQIKIVLYCLYYFSVRRVSNVFFFRVQFFSVLGGKVDNMSGILKCSSLFTKNTQNLVSPRHLAAFMQSIQVEYLPENYFSKIFTIFILRYIIWMQIITRLTPASHYPNCYLRIFINTTLIPLLSLTLSLSGEVDLRLSQSRPPFQRWRSEFR